MIIEDIKINKKYICRTPTGSLVIATPTEFDGQYFLCKINYLIKLHHNTDTRDIDVGTSLNWLPRRIEKLLTDEDLINIVGEVL